MTKGARINNEEKAVSLISGAGKTGQLHTKEYGSAGEYQADEHAGVARLRWRLSGK